MKVVPVQFESLGQESPVGSVRTWCVQTAADLLADEVGDLKGARAGQSRAALIHQQELGVEWSGVLQHHNTGIHRVATWFCFLMISFVVQNKKRATFNFHAKVLDFYSNCLNIT